jgi:hypothetical protein
MEWHRLDSSGSGQGLVASSYEHGNELSNSINFFGNSCVPE